jgi:hypothetical protein
MFFEDSLFFWGFTDLINGVLPGVHNPDIFFVSIGSNWQERSMTHQLLSTADAFKFLLGTVVRLVLDVGIFYSHYYNFTHGNKTG